MNEREFAPVFCGNIQQRQRHSLAPRGSVSARGARFIKAADDITHTLVDGFTPAVLLELPLLILLHKQRKRLRRGKHGKLRTDSTGKIIAQLQRVGFSAAIGVAVALALREDLTKPAEVL